ncbi:sugar ABC transporter permease [Pseudokineococcus basanitobsidens]|uniref:Sugar ABC transporter permease n=1 Tax=Pseudokineococcus basanitobsidens TaxID=1926649 RepID=A0ABU8RNK9_9ACTN
MSAADARPGPATGAGATRAGRSPRPPLSRGARARRRRDTRAALLFISPWVVGFAVFTAWPMLYSAYLSLTDYDVINAPSFVGLDNYRRLADDPDVVLAVGNTLWYAVVQVPLHVLTSLGLALLLERAGGRTAGFFRTAFYLPNMTPPVAVGVLLLLLFNGQSGLVNEVLGWVGVDGPAWTTDPAWVKPGLVLVSLLTTGSSVIILLAALRDVPRELYDAALVDGAGFWRRTLRITVPMISGPLFFVTVIGTISALQAFTEAYTAYFGAGNSTYSNDAALFYSIHLFRTAFEYLQMGYASAMAWALFVVILLVTLVQLRLSRRFVYYEGDQR